jgi:Tol biopolymer transport system component
MTFPCPSVDAHGKLIVYADSNPTLLNSTSNRLSDIRLFDRQQMNSTIIPLTPADTQPDGDTISPVISLDGKFIAFASYASNLIPGDLNNKEDIFLLNVDENKIARVPSVPRYVRQPFLYN